MSHRDDPLDPLVDAFLQRRIDRRQFLRRATALGVSLPMASAVLAACGGNDESSGTGGTAGTGGGGGGDGATLRIRMVNDISNLDPAFYPTGSDTQAIYPVMEGLVTYKYGSSETVNVLADTFEVSSDGLSIEFALKQGIQFHGGYGEVTADDVKFSYERIAGMTKPKIDSPYRGDWAPQLKEVRVRDKYSGTIVLKEPFAALMNSTMPMGSGWVLSQKAVEERGKKYATSPIGTGPYEFVKWTPKQRVVLKRFADYGGAAPAELLGDAFAEMQFIPIEDANAADIALETGEVDFGEISPQGVDRFKANDQFTVIDQTTLNYNWIGMNMLHPKLEDIRVRQAIRLAVDVPAIIEAAFEGKVTRATAIIPPNMGIGYWEDAPVYDRDVDQARSLLSDAGADGLALSLTFTEETGARDLAQIVQQNVDEVGIKLSLNQVDSAAMYELGKNLRDRELFYTGYVTQPDPSWSTVWFTCRQFDEWNWMYWCDEEYDRLHFAALKELDEARRQEMYVTMQQRWDEAAHTIWTHWPTLYFGMKAGVEPAIINTGYYIAQGFRLT
jgi:peptide/nickel transport system substrate-binding protein